MRAYRNEATMSRALIHVLTKHCQVVQRIETGETGRGVPDIYCVFPERDVWLELKNTPRRSIMDQVYDFNWRPGQQAWQWDYFLASGKRRSVVNVLGMSDGFVMYEFTHRCTHNLVLDSECYVYHTLQDVWKVGLASRVLHRY